MPSETYPGAHVGYCTVASVLIDLKLIDRLDEERPVNPALFRETENAATVDAALPGSNVVTRDHTSARDAFRESVFEVLHDRVVDEQDRTRLLETFEVLLKLKRTSREQSCPYEHCDLHVTIGPGASTCPCDKRRTLYCTDALRIHERFSDAGTNGEAFGLVSEVWGKILLVHVLRPQVLLQEPVRRLGCGDTAVFDRRAGHARDGQHWPVPRLHIASQSSNSANRTTHSQTAVVEDNGPMSLLSRVTPATG